MVIMGEGTKNKIVITSYCQKSVEVQNNPMNIVSEDDVPGEKHVGSVQRCVFGKIAIGRTR